MGEAAGENTVTGDDGEKTVGDPLIGRRAAAGLHAADPGAIDPGALDPTRPSPGFSADATSAEIMIGDDALPRRVGPYAVIRELGRGGQGVVFLAHDPRLNRQVALKVLTVPLLSGSDPLMRFRREAAAAARLDHPGICPVYEIGSADGAHYIAMRFVEGESLARKLAAARRESNKTSRGSVTGSGPKDDLVAIASIIERAARALHAAHEEGVVHRDVKPANLMITPEGEVVVMDFGLAHDREAVEESLTRTGDIFGTPTYMAPEQLQASIGPADRRIDVYALGVTLYEALTLRAPFAAQTRQALFHQILSEEPVDARRLNPAIPRDLAVIIGTALEKSPARRYQSALALADDLARFKNLEPILARPAGPIVRTARWAQRNPGVAVLSLSLVIGLFSGLVWMSVKNAELTDAYAAVVTEQKAKATARAREKRRAAEVRALANDVLFGVADAIASLPGATRARELVADKGLKSIESLVEDAEYDPSLRRDLAFAYSRVGDILGNPGVANLGRNAEARAKFEAAIKLLDTLVAERPEDAELLAESAHVRHSMTYLGLEAGKSEEALRHCDAAASFADRAFDLSPGDLRFYSLKVQVHRRRADLLARVGNRAESLKVYEKATEFGLAYRERVKSSPGRCRALTALLLDHATALAVDQRTTEALALFSTAEEIANEVKMASDDDLEGIYMHARIKAGLARAFLATQNVDQAYTLYDAAHTIMERLVTLDPANQRAKNEALTFLLRVADMLAMQTKADQAIEKYEAALVEWRSLEKDGAATASVRFGISRALVCIGDMYATKKDDRTALQRHSEALPLLQELSRQDEKDAVRARDLAVAHMKIGEDHQEIAKSMKDEKSEREHLQLAQKAFETALSVIESKDLMNRVGGVDRGMEKYVKDQITASKRSLAEIED